MKGNDSATATAPIALPGLGLAFLGVLGFSFSFPATLFALEGFDPYVIGLGRAAIAAVPAALALLAVRARPPGRAQLLPLVGVAAGVVLGFPLLSTVALDGGASASHAAVVIGLLPTATAAFAVLRAGERPSLAFWAASAGGAVAVTMFALSQGAGHLTPADLLLFGGLLAGALGYAEGGRLARELPAWQVISWALVLSAPVTVTGAVARASVTGPHPTVPALLGLAYVGAVSMFLGFFAWYAGLARAGVARAGQVQLAQPFLTLVWSWLFLGERMDPATLLAALAVLCSVSLTQRARVRAAPPARRSGLAERPVPAGKARSAGEAHPRGM